MYVHRKKTIHVFVCVSAPAACWLLDSCQSGGSLSACRRSHTDMLSVDACSRTKAPESRGDLARLMRYKTVWLSLGEGLLLWNPALCILKTKKQEGKNHHYDRITDTAVRLLQFSSNLEIFLLQQDGCWQGGPVCSWHIRDKKMIPPPKWSWKKWFIFCQKRREQQLTPPLCDCDKVRREIPALDDTNLSFDEAS